jgi:hypothetical protein
MRQGEGLATFSLWVGWVGVLGGWDQGVKGMFTLRRAKVEDSVGRMGMVTVMSSGAAPFSVTETGGPAVVVAGMGMAVGHEVRFVEVSTASGKALAASLRWKERVKALVVAEVVMGEGVGVVGLVLRTNSMPLGRPSLSVSASGARLGPVREGHEASHARYGSVGATRAMLLEEVPSL